MPIQTPAGAIIPDKDLPDFIKANKLRKVYGTPKKGLGKDLQSLGGRPATSQEQDWNSKQTQQLDFQPLYGIFSPEYLQKLANQGDPMALKQLNWMKANTGSTDTGSILDKFPSPKLMTPVVDTAASDLLRTGMTAQPEIQTTGLYRPPAEGTALSQVRASLIPDINYSVQSDAYLEGAAAFDPKAAAELEQRRFDQTGVEGPVLDVPAAEEKAVAPSPKTFQPNFANMADNILEGYAAQGNPEAVRELDLRNQIRGWTKEELERFITDVLKHSKAVGKSPTSFKGLEIAQEELERRRASATGPKAPADRVQQAVTAAEQNRLSQTLPVEPTAEEGVAAVQEVADETGVPELDLTPLTGPELATFTQKYDQNPAFSEKMYSDLNLLKSDYGHYQFPKAYQTQFDAWVSQGGTGVGPDLVQIMGPATATAGEAEVVESEVVEPEWVPPAGYVPTETGEAVTIDPVDRVEYDRVDIPTAGGTSPETLTTVAPYDSVPVALPQLGWTPPAGYVPTETGEAVTLDAATPVEYERVETEAPEATTTTELAPYERVELPELSTISRTIPGQTPIDTATGAEDMEDLARARRAYYEQYEAQPLLAQSEQERSALGRLRGQMMARQGLSGSPLGVGLGMQQEAQMRSLALQEVGRGRAAMELQLQEQRYLADQAAADRALQAQQFGVTTGLQQAEMGLRQQELASQQELQRAGLDIRQQEFATTTALAKSEQELRKDESDASLELERLNQEIRQREFGTTTGLKMSDQELQRQQINATLKLQQAEQAIQQKQFAATTGLQQSEIRLRQQELATQQALQRAGLDIRQHEFATTTALAKSEQELRKEESDARLELDKLNMEIRQREFGTTTGLEMSDQELRRQQINASLQVQQAEMAVSQKEFAASIGLQISQQELEKLRIDATERLNKSSLALEREQFGAEKGFRETEQDLQQQQFEATRDLGVANQLLRERQVTSDETYRNAEFIWRQDQATIGVELERKQQALEEDRINATRDLQEADQALREQQFGAATAFQVTQADLEERQFQAQEQLNRIDQEFKQSQLDASLEMDQADQLFRDKQLGVTTGLQRAQLAIEERGLIFETESDRLDREFRERQLESSIGLEESQLGLSERQLEQNKLTQLSEQMFKENQLAQQLGLAVTDQELQQQQFKAGLLQEESAQKFKKHEADASRHLAIMNLDLQQQTIKNNNDLQVAQQDLREEIQLFNVSEAGLQNYRSNEELRLKQDAHTVRIAELAASKENFEKQLELQRKIAEQKNKTAQTGQYIQGGVTFGGIVNEVREAIVDKKNGKEGDPKNIAMAGGGNADEGAANQFADELGGLGGADMADKVVQQAGFVMRAAPGNAQVMANAMDVGDLQLIGEKAEDLEAAINELMGQTAELGVNTALAGPETGGSNVGMRPLTAEEKISYGEVSTLPGSEVSKLGDNRSAIDRVAAEMSSTDTNSQSPKFGDATLPVAGSEVGPDYQKNQRQMVDQLIMMAGSSGEYDDNAMTAQLNKTDLKTLITAMATRTALPFTLTKRQQVALQKMVGLPWFQAVLKGGII